MLESSSRCNREEEGVVESRLGRGHLGGDCPFAFELGLVSLKGLLSTVLELIAVVVLWETVLG